jgi:nucleotide-binding universal stress UspA family protein
VPPPEAPELPRLGTILCPVDLSRHSQAGLYTAAGLSMAGGPLSVLRVIGRDEDAGVASAELKQFVQAVLPGWPMDTVELTVRSGYVPETILAASVELRANLVVMGTRGRGPIARAMLGSVTAEVLRRTSTPVAVIPPSHPEIVALGETRGIAQFGSLLVPVDLEEGSIQQIDMAVRLSSASANPITMLHVLAPGASRAAPLERMQLLATRFGPAADVRLEVREGMLAAVIGDLVGSSKAGVVVLGRSALNPGRVALEISRRGRAVLIIVP